MVGGYQPLEGESGTLYSTELGSKSLPVELARFELCQARQYRTHVTIQAQVRWNTTQFKVKREPLGGRRLNDSQSH